MERIELQTTVRKSTGNSPARSLRRSGHIPAVLYGPKMESVLLSVNIKDLEQVLKQGNIFQVILNLVIQNGKKVTKAAMVKELQTHPVSGNFIHIDFYEIDMKRQINVMVPIITNGQSVGVENGGMLNIVRREIELLCLPGDIPEAIEIDITDLDIGDSVHIEDIPLGVTLKSRRILILRWLPYLARRSKKKRWLKKRKANSRTVKKQRAKRLGKPTNPQRKNSSNSRLESPARSCDQIQMWRRPSSLLL